MKVGDCVLPISTTSGVWSAEPSAVWRRGTRPLQSCSSMTSFEPGFSDSNVVVRYSRRASGVSVPLSHSLIVAASGVPASVGVSLASSPLPHAVSVSAAATPTAAKRRIFTLGFLP